MCLYNEYMKAIVGRALVGTPGPLQGQPLWAPLGPCRQTLMDSPGPLWSRPLWRPLGPHGPGPNWPGPLMHHSAKFGQFPITYFRSIIPMRNCHTYTYIHVNLYYIHLHMTVYRNQERGDEPLWRRARDNKCYTSERLKTAHNKD